MDGITWMAIIGGAAAALIFGSFLWYLTRLQAKMDARQSQATASGLVFQRLALRPSSGPSTSPAPAAPAPTTVVAVPPVLQPRVVERDWINELITGFHLLIVGGTRGGKTVVAHHIAIARSLRGHLVLVCDPDARPGMWPGCTVAGGGDDWHAIDGTLDHIIALIQERRALRSQGGQRTFDPVTLVWSEATYILTECPAARAVMEDVLRRGAKLGICLLMDVQDSQTSTLRIEGQSSLLINLVRVERTSGEFDDSAWLPPGNDYHNLSAMGRIVFAGIHIANSFCVLRHPEVQCVLHGIMQAPPSIGRYHIHVLARSKQDGIALQERRCRHM
mgnify:CR=1 FL=1